MKVINEFGRIIKITFISNDVIANMNKIIDCIDEKGKKEDEDFLNYDEIKVIRDTSLQAISEVEALMKIENYNFHKNIAFSDDRPSSIIEKAKRFMQIRPTALTIGLIIYSFIALFAVYTEFGIDSSLLIYSLSYFITFLPATIRQ